MAKSKDNRTMNIPSNPIRSVEDERYKKLAKGRDKFNKRRTEAKKRHESYQTNIAEFKAEQLETAKREIQNNAIPNPADMLIGMIKEAKMILSDPELSNIEYHKERQMYLALYKEYAALTGANAPSAQSIDMDVRQEEVKTSKDITEELILITNELRR